MRAITAMHPMVIILDDLHWSDPASLDLLRPLARMVSALPILIIAAYRSDRLPREHALNVVASLLVREADADRIVLDRLTKVDLRAYVAGRLHTARWRRGGTREAISMPAPRGILFS